MERIWKNQFAKAVNGRKFLTGCDFAGLAYAIFYTTCLSEHADGAYWINETRNFARSVLEINLYRSVL